MVLDHFGAPLGVGRYRDQREAIFTAWKKDIAGSRSVQTLLPSSAVSRCRKTARLAARKSPTSDKFVEAQKRYYLRDRVLRADRCCSKATSVVKWSISYRCCGMAEEDRRILGGRRRDVLRTGAHLSFVIRRTAMALPRTSPR
jgi:hypothetical protein